MNDENERALLEEITENKSHGSTIVSRLRSAVNSGYRQRVLALLDGGADINAQDRIGDCTALTHVAWIGRDDVVELLLENGADPNRREQHGRTALHIAVKHRYSGIMTMLIEHGPMLMPGFTTRHRCCLQPSTGGSRSQTTLSKRGPTSMPQTITGEPLCTGLLTMAMKGWHSCCCNGGLT